MNKENFDSLPQDQQWTIVKTYLEIFQFSVSKRMSLLPSVAGLSATLLVVATFNEKLIPLDNSVCFIVSILLLLIPLSLYFYNDDLKMIAENTKKEIDGFHEKKSVLKTNVKGTITKWLPDVSIYILFVLVIILIIKIW